jgi:hypothetical protein
MQMTESSEDDRLDRLLNSSRPAVFEPSTDIAADLDDLISASKPSPRRRGRRRLAIGAGVMALFAAGGGLAAAMEADWSPWIEKPIADYRYTLPSGNTCTVRVGDIASTDARMVAAIEDFYDGGSPAVDVAAALERRAADPDSAQLADGTIVDIVPGSPLYNEDRNYRAAMDDAIRDALQRHLFDRGLSSSWTGASESQCSNEDELELTAEDLGFESNGTAP